MFRVDQIDHVELFVPDPYQAASWYQRVFGLEIMREMEHWAQRGPLMISSDGGSTKLALFRGEPAPAPETAAFRCLAFRVDGITFVEFLDRVEELDLRDETGCRLDTLRVSDHQEAVSVYFQDPWGHRLELTTYEPERVTSRRE